MAANYLEQMIAVWYEYRGFFVRRNVLVGKRPKGGYECELDVVAYGGATTDAFKSPSYRGSSVGGKPD